ncbi:MAG TPA: hypothetical protein VEA16_19090 [Vicinamibacterales bacterium]|nr:hypothetical protein [Vicinamibacterales bacterium]
MADQLDLMRTVAETIRRRFEIEAPIHVDYPGFISIPDAVVHDDAGDGVWCVGPALEEPGAWTGQLMTADGSEVINEMTFCVYPVSDSPEDIADAVYVHGIGDWYVGGGCPECPVRKPVRS